MILARFSYLFILRPARHATMNINDIFLKKQTKKQHIIS